MLRPASALTVVSSNITSNTTWTTAGDATYEIASSMSVSTGVTLTIQPGVTVRFRQYVGMWVYGTLNAVGNSGSRITITGTSAAKGWWRGIHVNEPGSATIAYTDISYSGYWDGASLAKSGSGSLSLTYSTIRDSSDRGLVVSEGYSSFVSANNQFNNNNGRGCHIGINASFDDATSTFSNNGGADVHLDGGTITTDTTWNLKPSYSFYLSGSITLGAGTQLTIKPGTVVKFGQYVGMWVQGTLDATGTSGSRIHFTDWRDDTVGGDANKDGTGSSPGAGWWRILKIQDPGAAAMDWCVLSYAGYWDSITLGKEGTGNLSLRNTTVKNGVGYGAHVSNSSGTNTVVNLTANAHSESGMYINNSTVSVTGCTFSNNGAYGVLHEVNDTIVYPDNTFTSNGTASVGINGGTIVKNITWTGAVDMVVKSSTTVGAGVTLTIQPGVTVKFAQYVGLWVEGTLRAIGLSGKSIAFTGTSASKGWWRGVHVVNSGNAALDYTNFSYSGYWDGVSLAKSGAGSLSLKNSVVRDSSDRGLVVSSGYSSFVSANNQFNNNNGRGCHIGINASFDDTTSTFSSNAGPDVHLDGGTITADTTWNLNPAYSLYVSGSITVATGYQLTIKPGTVVKFAQYTGIWVEGTLNAAGTSEARIHFTDWRDDTVGGDANKDAGSSSPGAGWWRALKVQGTGTAVMDWCVLSYAGYWDSITLWKEGSGDITVSNTTASKASGYGFYISNSSGSNTFTRITATGNSASGMYVNNSPVTIAASVFSNNGAYGLLHEINDTVVYPDNFFMNNGSSNVGVNGGTISKNITWARGIDMEIRGNVTIVAGSTLTIQPGVTVKFAQYNAMWVEGNLNAVGTPDAPITFTGTSASKGWWRGMHVTGAGNATLAYADMSYAGYWDGATLAKSGTGSLSLTNSSIHDSSDRGLVVSAGYSEFESMNNHFGSNNGRGCHIGINASFDDATSHFSDNIGPDVYVDGGSMSTSTVWNVNPLYSLYLSGSITVMPEATLTIRQGTVVKVAQYTGLWVEGTLEAKGTSGSHIRFTDWRDDTVGGDANKDGSQSSPAAGWWRVLHVYNSGQATLEWSSLAYAGYWDGVGLWKNGNGALTLVNTTITNVGGEGLRMDASTGDDMISRSTFEENTTGIRVINQTQPVLMGSCQFEGNGSYGILNSSTAITVDARSCWWGSETGPQHASNPEGTGDKVSDAVLFEPWRRTKSAAAIQTPVRSGTLVAGDTLRFTGLGEAGQSYLWNFGYGRTNTSLNPGMISFPTVGQVQVKLNTAKAGVMDPFPDVRDFDVVVDNGARPDLRTTQLVLPASLKIGQTTSIRYTVSNVGDGPASGTWNDAIYLSEDAWLDGSDTPLGGATVTKNLAAGEGYQGQIDVRVPVVEEGAHFLLVSVDDTWQVVDKHRLNNEKSGSASVLIPDLVAGDPISDTLEGRYVGEGHHFRVDMAKPGNLLVRTTGNVTVYVSTSGLAGSRNFTWQGSSAQDLLLSGVPAGPVFIQVVNNSTGESTDYTLVAELADLVLSKVSPPQIAAGIDTTLTVEGLGFRPGVNVTLVRGATRVPAVAGSVQVFSNQRLTADFRGSSLTQGTYQLEVSGTGLVTATLANAVSVSTAAQPRLTLNLVTPSQLGYHGLGTLYVEYANEGDAPMRAPMILLTPKQNGIKGAILTLDGNIVSQGFWSSTLAAGFSTSIQLLGSGEVAGMLMPGEQRRVPVYYAGWLQPWNFNYPAFDFELRAIMANDARPVPWSANEELIQYMRPQGMNDAAWAMVRDSLIARWGSTVGQFITRVGENATYLQNLGERTDDIGTLVTFEVNKARGAFHPVSVLAAATDLEAGVPGEIPFLFGRWYAHDIGARHAAGALGTGWAHAWEYHLTTLADGTLMVSEPGGGRRIFHPDQRGGYLAVAGDQSRMQAVSGGYQLTGMDGNKMNFNSEGRLTAVTDPLGHSVTLSYSGGVLAGLAHSSGASITFTNQNGRIVSAADQYGRTVRYTYDGAGRLSGCTDAAGRRTTYAYDATHAALSTVTDPAGRTRKFSYDNRHHLNKATDGAGATVATTASYAVNGARVTVTDGLGRSFGLAYDHKGMIRVSSDPYGRQGLFGYDHASRNTSILDEKGFGVRYQRDSRGNVTRVAESAGESSSFAYDSKNRLTSSTDGMGRRYDFSYDGSNNVTRMSGPDGNSWEWTYGADGLPTTFKDRAGVTESYTWNSKGQLTSTATGDGTILGQYAYDGADRISRLSNGSGTVDLSYNAQDSITRAAQDDGRALTFGYDAQGRRTFVANQTGHRVNYHYDALSRLSRLSDAASATIVEYTYDPAGRLSRKTLGNGTYTDYETDAYGRVTSQNTYRGNGSVLSSLSLVYDRTGRLKTHSSDRGVWRMEYGPTGHLVKRGFTAAGASAPESEETFSYDAAGQLMARTYNGTAYDIVRDDWGRVVDDGERSFTYDAEGHLVSRNGPGGVINYTTDAEGRIIAASAATGTANFSYDAMGVIESSGQTGGRNVRWQVDPMGSGPLCALDDGGKVVEAFYQGLGMAARDAGGARFYPEYDPATGNQLFETNAAGNKVATGAPVPPVSPLGLASVKKSSDTISPAIDYVGGVPFGGFGMDPVYSFGPNEVEMVIKAGQNLWNHPTTQQALDKTVRNPVVGFGTSMIGIATDPMTHKFIVRGASWLAPKVKDYVVFTGKGEFLRDLVKWKNSGASNVLGKGLNVLGLVTGAVEVVDGVTNAKDRFETAEKVSHGVGTIALGVAGLAAGAAAAPMVAAVGVGLFVVENLAKTETGQKAFYYVFGGAMESFWNWWDDLEPNPGNFSGRSVGSMDPNELIGPAGHGTANFMGLASSFGYRIDFENDPEALAPAQIVTITHDVNDKLDRATYSLTALGFGDVVIPVPANDGNFFTTVDLVQDEVEMEVEIDASYNPATGRMVVRFTTIDKATGLPPAVEYGFLPAEDDTGRGKGFVSYAVSPLPALTTSTEIRSVAVINFDFSYDIQTNQVDPHDPSKGTDPNKEALVTIDATAPTSKVSALPAGVKPVFPVTWSGNDGNGSGIASYTVYVSENSGATWRPWLTDTSLTTAPFTGTAGKRYRFNVIAKDWVGNAQALNPANATADTLVVGSAMIVVLDEKDKPLPAGKGTLAYGKVQMGKTVRKTVTIRNRGPLNLTGIRASVGGKAGKLFKVEGLKVTSLAAGKSTTFTVVYSPKDAKAHKALLTIASSDVHVPKYGIALTGTGMKELKPEIAVLQGSGAKKNLKDNKSTRDFGVVKVSASSKPMVFTIKNTGTAPLKKVKVTLSGKQARDYKVVKQPSKSVKPGKSTQFKVVFKPGKPTTSKALLKIASNDKDENPFRVKLTGKGK
jgi:YD repeat-containing protein